MLTILIPSCGRSTLDRTLASIAGQNALPDQVFCIGDGIRLDHALPARFPSLPLRLLHHPRRLGHWRHAIRNAYQPLLTGYVLHMDDDDVYLPGAIAAVRQRIAEHPDQLLIFRVRCLDGVDRPEGERLEFGKVSTLCGCVPCRPDLLGEWTPRSGGDYDFYADTAERMAGIRFFPEVIARVIPHWSWE